MRVPDGAVGDLTFGDQCAVPSADMDGTEFLQLHGPEVGLDLVAGEAAIALQSLRGDSLRGHRLEPGIQELGHGFTRRVHVHATINGGQLGS